MIRIRPHAVLTLCILAMMVVRSPRLAAQSPTLVVDAGVSHTLPPGESLFDEASSYVLLGTRFDVPASGAVLFFGSAYTGLTPDTDVGSWASGSLGTVFVVPVSSVVDVGATVWGGAFTVGGRLPYSGLTGRVSPELRLWLGGWSLALRGAGGLGRTDTTFERDRFSLVSSDNLWSYGGGAEIGRIAGRASAFLGADVFESSRGSYVSGYARAILQTGSVVTRLELGLWDTPTGFEPTGLVALSIPLGGGVRAELSGGRSAPDPLLATPPAGDFGAILSWQAIGAPPRTSDIVHLAGNEATIAIDVPAAEKVYVVGDFTLWIPVRMEPGASGGWTVTLAVEPGRYQFGFLVDGEWYVPADAGGIVIDEWGQPNATLIVPEVY